MNVIKCSNGHFFDGDSYQVCPHCGAPVWTLSQTQQPETKEKRKGLFGKNTKETTAGTPISQAPGTAPNSPSFNPQYSQNGGGFGDGRSPTVDLPSKSSPPAAAPKKKEVTLDFWQTSSSPAPIASEESAEQPDILAGQPTDSPDVNAQESPVAAPADETGDSSPKARSLLEKVRSASATSEGKTMSYFSAVTADPSADKPKAVNVPAQIDPVVGWLVCIHGEHFGESFQIGAGMNSIGRSEGNRIVLNRDPSVSREKHALITFEPKHRQFYVKPGDSSGLTYVNDEYITETKRVNAKDVIEIGNSRFLFVPLCGEDFTWEDYMKG